MTQILTRRVEDLESTLFYSVAHGDYAISMTVMVDGERHAGLDLWGHDKSADALRLQAFEHSPLMHCNILDGMASCDAWMIKCGSAAGHHRKLQRGETMDRDGVQWRGSGKLNQISHR